MVFVSGQQAEFASWLVYDDLSDVIGRLTDILGKKDQQEQRISTNRGSVGTEDQ